MNEIVIERPGYPRLVINHLFLDFTGTLSRDGKLIEGVADRLQTISTAIKITVLTADTFGTAANELAGLPVELEKITSGGEKDLRVMEAGEDKTAAIGNGMNDVLMVKRAALGIAVIGPEGAAGELLKVAGVVVTDIRDGLDLLIHPRRLTATLRA